MIFYTGSGSDYANAAAAIEAKKSNSKIDLSVYNSKFYSSFIYYLILALNHIDFHWGICKRWINLKNGEDKGFDDYSVYKVGNIITWVQFSSSYMANSDADVEAFSYRNTKFIIWSIKGRDIS